MISCLKKIKKLFYTSSPQTSKGLDSGWISIGSGNGLIQNRLWAIAWNNDNRVKARYGGSNMKKNNNGCRLLISYMMEGIKKVTLKNGILWLFSVTDPPKIQDGRHI